MGRWAPGKSESGPVSSGVETGETPEGLSRARRSRASVSRVSSLQVYLELFGERALAGFTISQLFTLQALKVHAPRGCAPHAEASFKGRAGKPAGFGGPCVCVCVCVLR